MVSMKKISIVLVLILVSVTIGSFTGKQTKDNSKLRLIQLKKEVSENLSGNIMPYWSTRMVDYKNGGFFGRIDANDKVYPAEDKGGILNARILWTYSSAYRILGDTAYLRLATRSKDYILKHFIDKQYGGAYRTVKSNGEPSDTRKQVYTQSFFIYGLSEYYRATGDVEALESAMALFELFEKYAADKVSNGYFEVFTREWKRSRDQLIGESSEIDEKTMNTHLHIMEAYTSLYRVWPDKRMKDCLRNMVELFLDRIIDPRTSHLICFMDRSWKRTSETDSYGHDIEASWLLYEAAGLLQDSVMLERVKKTSIKIADAASEGLQNDGSLIYEKNLTTGHENTERSWWAQSETIIGYLNAYEITGDEKYLDKSLKCWDYTKNHFIDRRTGGWFSSVSEEGIPGRGDKGGFWVCPYHNGRMCMEIIERISYH